ncbi:hypothetical protein ANRL2_01888 [Anaerolineae bacterium]|nr:hypothetical protein ANRL2_01888 [Anaerolineae bacterium]
MEFFTLITLTLFYLPLKISPHNGEAITNNFHCLLPLACWRGGWGGEVFLFSPLHSVGRGWGASTH